MSPEEFLVDFKELCRISEHWDRAKELKRRRVESRPMALALSRRWRNKGSPFFNADGYKCSEEGYPNVSYKTKGAAYHLRICQSCYKKTAKVSGSSHSADDRSANLLLCENCPEDAK